jgi:AcrR family transcriptional regulator
MEFRLSTHPNKASKEKLIEVALDLFATKGFKGTSIRNIANAMDMSISNIYHYFGNKEGLVLAILERSAKDLVDTLREVSESEMETDPLIRICRLIDSHIRISFQHKNESKIFFLDKEDLAAEGHEINRRIQVEVLRIYEKEIRALENAGYVKCRSTKVMAFNVLALINWVMRWYREDGALSQEEIIEEITLFAMHGLLGPGAPDIKERCSIGSSE